jgi:hypothetical protein
LAKIVRPQYRHTRVRIDVIYYVYVFACIWWHHFKSGSGIGLVQDGNKNKMIEYKDKNPVRSMNQGWGNS